MARVSFAKGLKCEQCGNISISFPRGRRYLLCQGCGAHLADHIENEGIEIHSENAELITVKVTDRLFSTTYEEVK